MTHRIVALVIGTSLLCSASAFASDTPRSMSFTPRPSTNGALSSSARSGRSTSSGAKNAHGHDNAPNEEHAPTSTSAAASSMSGRPKGFGSIRPAAVKYRDNETWKSHAPGRGDHGPLVDAPGHQAPARAYFPIKAPQGKVPAEVAHMTTVFEHAYAAHVGATNESERDVSAMRLGLAYEKLYNASYWSGSRTNAAVMDLGSQRGGLVEKVRVGSNARYLAMLRLKQHPNDPKTLAEVQQATDELIEHATALGTVVGSANAEKQTLGEPWKQGLKAKLGVLREGFKTAAAIVQAPYAIVKYGAYP